MSDLTPAKARMIKAKWDAEDNKPKRQKRRTPAKSAPAQEVHPSTAPAAPQGRTSCTLTFNEPLYNHSTLHLGPARDDEVKGTGIKNGHEGKVLDFAGLLDDLKKRAGAR